MRDEMPDSHMILFSNSPGFVKCVQGVIKIVKEFVGKAVVLQKTVSEEHEYRAPFEEKLTKMKSSVSASDKLAAEPA